MKIENYHFSSSVINLIDMQESISCIEKRLMDRKENGEIQSYYIFISDRYNNWECRKCISISSVIFSPNENEKEEINKYLQNIPVDSGANKEYYDGERKIIQSLQKEIGE